MDIKSEAQEILKKKFSGKKPREYDGEEIPTIETLIENDVPNPEILEGFISLREFMKTHVN